MREKFDACFKKQGGILQSDSEKVYNIIANSNALIKHIQRSYTNLPDIYFNLIDNNVINASASLYEGHFFVGINIGAVNLLEDLFLKISSANSFTLEDTPKLNLINTPKGLEYDSSFDIYLVPLSEAGYYFSSEYYELVYRFIVYHEICHVLRGHVGYLSSLNILNIDEASTTQPNEEINILQTLEMDADSFATNRIMNDFFENSIKVKDPDLTIYKDWKSFLSNFAYSLYCFFRIFGFYTLETSSIKSKSHPSPALRISMIMSNVATILLDKKIENIDDILDETVKSIITAEDHIGKVTFFDNQLKNFAESYINIELEKYIFEVIGNWKVIKPQLEEHSFCDLPK